MRSVSFCLSSFAPEHFSAPEHFLITPFRVIFKIIAPLSPCSRTERSTQKYFPTMETTGIFIIDVFQWEIFTNQKNFGALFERCICILLGRLVAHSGTGTTPLRPILKFLLYSCSEPNPMFRSTLGIESFRALQVEHVLNMLITNMIQILLLGP